MKTVWAPWRMEFILSAHKHNNKSSKKCVFCLAQKGPPSVKNLVLYSGKLAFVIMNKYPYSNGHLLILPKRHIGDFAQVTPEEHAEMGLLLNKSLEALKSAMNPEGFNIGMNLGKVAGAGIREHLHYHIVPRWNGDHNFMPVIGDIRVMPEFLEDTYKKLRKEF